jgi:hypothetical protein
MSRDPAARGARQPSFGVNLHRDKDGHVIVFKRRVD